MGVATEAMGFLRAGGSAEDALAGTHRAGATRVGGSLLSGMVEVLGRAIVARRHDVADFPTEASLSRKHGVSRSVTREAVKTLAAKGLLGGRPGYGIFVQPDEQWNIFDTDVLRWLEEASDPGRLLGQIRELRATVEPEAAALAASRAAGAQLHGLHLSLRRIAEEDGGACDASARADFHAAVLTACANPFYAQFRALTATDVRITARMSARSGQRGPGVAAYRAACAAIAERRPCDARVAMARLIEPANPGSSGDGSTAGFAAPHGGPVALRTACA